ncbi:GLPGLI family protein [Flavobacteriaceae bacterium]|nr:GLPGLI family protein [Flavobacteriaceae bacterium]MDC1534756.1 GLPGLI family protein [Flavobacteriaceae bacterium]
MNKLLSFLLFLIISTNLFSQDFQGKAFYQSKTTMDLGSWGNRMSAEQKNAMKDRMKPYLEKTFILTFNKTESTFKEEERLDAPGSGGSGMGAMFMSAGSGNPEMYKNIKEKVYLQENEFFGKKFLVNDKLPEFVWQMSGEQKQIGKYICFKAVGTRVNDNFSWESLRGQRNQKPNDSTNNKENDKSEKVSDVDDETNTKVEKIEEVVVDAKIETIVAWYTPQIPISNGPEQSYGLPGLILELNTKNTTMLCSKIVLNPEKKDKIIRPTKGDVVSKKEYTEMVQFKMQEMRDNRGRSRGGRWN